MESKLGCFLGNSTTKSKLKSSQGLVRIGKGLYKHAFCLKPFPNWHAGLCLITF